MSNNQGRLEELCKSIVALLGAKACIIVVVGAEPSTPSTPPIPGKVELNVETSCMVSIEVARYLPKVLREIAVDMEKGLLPPGATGNGGEGQ